MELCFELLAIPGSILLVLITVFICILFVCYRRRLTITDRANFGLALLLFGVSVMFFVVFPKLREDYFGRIVPFLIICSAYPLAYFRRIAGTEKGGWVFRYAALLIIACVVSSVGCRYDMLTKVTTVSQPQNWIPMKVHSIALEIAGKTTSPKPAATLAPLYAIEGGRNIYPELSAGPFAYKVVAALSHNELDATHTITPKQLKQQLHENPPSIVILNAPARQVEFVLLRIAKTNWPKQQYDKQLWERKQYENFLTVYIRKDRYYKPTKPKPKPFYAYNK